jgi:putative ABC transport system permease protein
MYFILPTAAGSVVALNKGLTGMDTLKGVESAGQDLRYAVRQLRANPGFAAVAVPSLALGIGANTAIFELVNAVRLRSLPVAKPQKLAYIDFQKGSHRSGSFSTRSARLTYAQWEKIRTRPKAFSATMAWSATRFNLAAGGQARCAEGLFVSATPSITNCARTSCRSPSCPAPRTRFQAPA